MSTPRSDPGARGDERRVGGHHVTIGQPLRTLRSTPGALFFHDHLRRLANSCYFPAAVKVIGKTLSTQAAARLTPPAICLNGSSPFWARSDELRSMFGVWEAFFWTVRALPGCRQENAKVGVFTARSIKNDCSARACGPDEPRGDPGGPGGEAQWSDGGSTAWTERASETPAGVKG